MKKRLQGLHHLCFLLFALFAVFACNPGPGPDLGVGNSQGIFDVWELDEVIRNSCDDANNNFRRACASCNLLTLNEDNSYELKGPEDELLQQGNFMVVNDNEIVFDPGIFTLESISRVQYTLVRGGLSFNYTDDNTDCAVIESYLAKGSNIAGD